MQGNGMNGQWTPEQAAQWQAMQRMTPEQAAQWQAMQAAQMGQVPGAQTGAWQAITPDQAAQWQAMQGAQGGQSPQQGMPTSSRGRPRPGRCPATWPCA